MERQGASRLAATPPSAPRRGDSTPGVSCEWRGATAVVSEDGSSRRRCCCGRVCVFAPQHGAEAEAADLARTPKGASRHPSGALPTPGAPGGARAAHPSPPPPPPRTCAPGTTAGEARARPRRPRPRARSARPPRACSCPGAAAARLFSLLRASRAQEEAERGRRRPGPAAGSSGRAPRAGRGRCGGGPEAAG